MRLQGSANQQRNDPLFCADITLTGSAQLALPRSLSRSMLIIQNCGANPMAVEIGSARATATLTNGVVSSLSVTNAGFGFLTPPLIQMLGGGYGGNTAFNPVGQPAYPPPQGGVGKGGVQAQVLAVLSGGALSSFNILNGGSGYQVAPFVWIRNSDLDPYGAALPAVGGAGIQLNSGASITLNGTACPTDSVSVIGTSGDILLARWMD